MLARLCTKCRAREEAAEAQKRAERAERVKQEEERAALEEEQALRERELERNRLVENRADELIASSKLGQRVFIYHSEYLSVDSVLMDGSAGDPPDLTVIRHMGLTGWEVVQAVPRTMGIGLTNASIGSTMGETWGGGVGGNVIGVYLLLKKELDFTRDVAGAAQRDELVEYLSSYF